MTQNNINSLKVDFPDKQIVLVENFKDEFLEQYEELSLDVDDYIGLLESTKFNNDEKISIVESIDQEILYNNEELIEYIISIYLESDKNIPKELFYELFEKSDFENQMNILIKQIPNLEKEDITNCLLEFEKPYSELTEKSARPLKIDYSEKNLKLIQLLRDKDYIGKKFDIEKENNLIKVNRKRK